MSDEGHENTENVNDPTAVCTDYTANELCDPLGKTKFDLNTILTPCTYFYVFVYLMIMISILFMITATFVFYVWFQIIFMNNFVVENDSFNMQKMKVHEMFYYKLLNYVYCFNELGEDVRDKQLKQQESIFDLSAKDSCYNKEPYAKITLVNEIYNLQVLLLETTAYVSVGVLMILALTGILSSRGYVIVGDPMKFLKGNMWVIVAFIIMGFTIICNAIIYKYYFMDEVVTNLFKTYNDLLTLDKFVYDQLQKSENDNSTTYLDYLDKLTIEDFNTETIVTTIRLLEPQQINPNIGNIIKDIRTGITNTPNDVDRNASKIFMYAIYIYFVNQNIDNVNILNIIKNILHQKPDEIYTFRSLLPVELQSQKIIFDLNGIVELLGDGIFIANPTTESVESYKNRIKDNIVAKYKDKKDTADALYKSFSELNTNYETKLKEINYKTDNNNEPYKSLVKAVEDAKLKLSGYVSDTEILRLVSESSQSSGSDRFSSLKNEIRILLAQYNNKINPERYPLSNTDNPPIQPSAKTAQDILTELNPKLLEFTEILGTKKGTELSNRQGAVTTAENNLKAYKEKYILPLENQITTIAGLIENLKPSLNKAYNEYYGKKIEVRNTSVGGVTRLYISETTVTPEEMKNTIKGMIENEITGMAGTYESSLKLDNANANYETKEQLAIERLTKVAQSAKTAADIYTKVSPPKSESLIQSDIDELAKIIPIKDDKTSTVATSTVTTSPNEIPAERLIKLDDANMELIRNLSEKKLTPEPQSYTPNANERNALMKLRDDKQNILEEETEKYQSIKSQDCSLSKNEFRLFDFQTIDITRPDLRSKVANKLKTFYTKLMSLDDMKGTLRFERILKHMNLVLVFIWALPILEFFFLLIFLWGFSRSNESLKEMIEYVIAAIEVALDEFVWGVIL